MLVVLALSFSHVLFCNLYIAGIRFEVVMKISQLDLPFYVQSSCILEFDGASKGNPGQAGAGAILRSADGNMVFRLHEGVGIATNNVAEYRGCILGLRYALTKGYKHICVRGDSKLVCMQVQGLWRTKTQNMTELCKIAKELKDQFLSFQIMHIERESNTEADAQANFGVHLKMGEIQVDCDMK
ncbi:uncharacterized protein Mb2253c-like [Salvia splendens]|uniref:uncharacterized protein Mb2253c-like n=1 Tax=Salvia splendens TaxID=180675 RepID=UPI001C27C035|nr:uncharacterized protein Mb2253c-like [Salvia splendens]XP_042021371.1 uncharacterized protein Mb2253c-like [Salvia splendens]XP_042021372.1 uncharacterized protein Mb2253c-like [Salvia splendens]XP_042021374.1 uncharacterized protein Mb2253c-like [Salvia splendens]